jgi:3-hydroxyisobutyrate dehydrogenase
VRDDAAVREVLLGERGALAEARPGTTFVNMSTTTPALAVELEGALAAAGHAFLDAPVTGSKAAAASGQLGILVSGDPRHLETNRDVLTAMGPTVRHVGPIGSSAALKLANNAVAATLMAILGEGLALAEASGLSREELVETFLTTVTRVYGLKKTKVIHRDYSTDFALDLMCKDLDQALETARRSHISMPLLTAVRDVHETSRTLGNGSRDFSVVADRG